MKKTAQEILNEAQRCLVSRAASRDNEDGERSMDLAVETFNTLTGNSLSVYEGWMFMAVLKLARHQNGKKINIDDFVDAAAYAALAGEEASALDEAINQVKAESENQLSGSAGIDFNSSESLRQRMMNAEQVQLTEEDVFVPTQVYELDSKLSTSMSGLTIHEKYREMRSLAIKLARKLNEFMESHYSGEIQDEESNRRKFPKGV